MKKNCSIRHLDLVNLTIAFCNRVAGIEPVLAHLGYRVRSAEFTFRNSLEERVKPDVILDSPTLNDALLFDCKTGADVKVEQVRRSGNITREDLVDRAFVQSGSADNLSFDVTIFCIDEHFTSIQYGLELEGFQFPVLALLSDQVKLRANHFGQQKVDRVFSDGVGVNRNAIPREFVPFDEESEDWEIAERVVPKIVEYMHQNKAQFSVSRLAMDVVKIWESFPIAEQGRFKKRMSYVVRLAAANQLKGYIKFDKNVSSRTREHIWQIVSNPLSKEPSRRTGEWQKLQRLGKQFVEWLRTGKKMPFQEELELWVKKGFEGFEEAEEDGNNKCSICRNRAWLCS